MARQQGAAATEDWAAAVATRLRTEQETAAQETVEQANRRRRLIERVTEDGPSFLAACATELERAVSEFNAALGVPFVRCYPDPHGGIVLRTEARDFLTMTPSWGPEDVQPAVRVNSRVRGAGEDRYFFVVVDGAGLAIEIGSAHGPVEAARAMLAPWLQALCRETAAPWSRAGALRLRMEPVVVPAVQSPGITIRPVTDDGVDLDAVLALDGAAFASAWTLGMFRAAGRDGRLVVATLAGRVVGFSAIGRRPPGGFLTLQRLAVAEDVRRRGIGRALLREVLAAAATAGATRVELDVNALNIAAGRLYRAAGFHVINQETVQ